MAQEQIPVTDLFVSPETARDASSGGAWKIPDDAAVKGDPNVPGPNNGAVWAEKNLEIAGSSMYKLATDPDTVIVQVDFAVAGDADSVNVGERPLRMWYRITPAAFGNASHAKYKGTKFNLDRLSKLLSACGVDVLESPEDINYGVYFAPQDGEIFVVGKRLGGIVEQSWYGAKKKQEITEFLPAGGA